MIKRIWCSLLSNDKPQDKNVIWIDTANPESYTLKLFRNGDWKPIQTVGTTRDMIERELTGNITSHYHSYDNIANKPTTLEGYGITNCFNKVEIERLLNNKQDTLIAGDNITIKDNIISSTGEGGLIDLSSYAKKEEVNAALAGKQDTISDLEAIRQGAQKGSTALQSYTETDPVYTADKPKLALKVEIPDVSGKVDKEVGKGLSSNDYTDADKLKLTGLENYDDTQIRELIAGKANLQHQHTVTDITDFPELYYDATAFFTSGAYPSNKYEELLEAVKAKKTVYATIDEEGYVSYVLFMSSANSDGSSSRILLTTIFADGGNLYINTFVLQQSGMTALQENITGKAHKATTLSGYGIADAYTKNEVDAAISSAITTTLNTEV